MNPEVDYGTSGDILKIGGKKRKTLGTPCFHGH